VKERLDKILVDRGVAGSRERAKALILAGRVLVNRVPMTKAGALVEDSADVSLRGGDIPYVSRGGVKLKAAIENFAITVRGKTCMDVGASTGGFTDCLLQEEARRVYAVDVGYGQFDWNLRNDRRVVLLERTNIRHLERDAVADTMDMVVIDVSFISLALVAPKALEFLKPGGEVVALIKPQFEVGKGEVGKGGVVRDEEKRNRAVEGVRSALEERGCATVGVMESPVKGQKGNTEYLIYLKAEGGMNG
jgi:23S rRNA (cytidine1920-2'-O)/16S rRNA (cytidine1409-2'-O)-methyltransferase